MHRVHARKVSLLDIIHHLLELVNYPSANKLHRYATCEKWSKDVLSCLVVYNCPFFFGSDLICKLSSHSCVPHRNGVCKHANMATFSDYEHSNEHHNWVEHSGITFERYAPRFVNIAETHKHVNSWDPHVVERGVSVALRSIAKFGANISSFYPWPVLPVFRISKLHHERLHTVVLLLNYESCEYDCMTRHLA